MKKETKSRAAQLPAGSEKERDALMEGGPRATAPASPVKKSKRGRKRERMQISVRLDQALMDIVYSEIERRKNDVRITDLVERGLILALRELGNSDPIYSQTRLILNNESVDLARHLFDCSAVWKFPELRPLSPLEQCFRQFQLERTATVKGWPGYDGVCQLLGGGAVAFEAKRAHKS